MNEPDAPRPRAFLGDFITAYHELHHFVELSWFGLHEVCARRDLATLLASADHRTEPDASLLPPAELESFARQQESGGFSYLHEIATIRLWSILEAAVTHLVESLLLHLPSTREAPAVRKLKGPLVEFAGAAPEDQAQLLLFQLRQELGVSLKPGPAKLEDLLSAIGLTGQLPDSVRRTLLELNQVRNVLVHRHGRADAALRRFCPWVDTPTGTLHRVSSSAFRRYSLAAHWYLADLVRRQLQAVSPTATDLPEALAKLEGTKAELEQQLSRDPGSAA